MAEEYITLQFGTLANYVGAHLLNFHAASFQRPDVAHSLPLESFYDVSSTGQGVCGRHCSFSQPSLFLTTS
jgi:hypothetical protein